MNVSFTRVRKKLVIVGSRRTLQREPLLASFFALMQEKGWIRALAPGAHKAHARVFDVAASPAKRGAGTEEDSDAPVKATGRLLYVRRKHWGKRMWARHSGR